MPSIELLFIFVRRKSVIGRGELIDLNFEMKIRPSAEDRRSRVREAGKWRIGFKAIVDRCGSHAEPKAGSPLSKDEINILKAIVVKSAGFRTK